METAEGIGVLFSGVLIVFVLIFYIAIFAGGIFLWYFIVKKAIIKGINQSILNKDNSKQEREIYLLKLEVNRLKAAQETQMNKTQMDTQMVGQKTTQEPAEVSLVSNELVQEAEGAVEAARGVEEVIATTNVAEATDISAHSIDLSKSGDTEVNEVESVISKEDEEQLNE